MRRSICVRCAPSVRRSRDPTSERSSAARARRRLACEARPWFSRTGPNIAMSPPSATSGPTGAAICLPGPMGAAICPPKPTISPNSGTSYISLFSGNSATRLAASCSRRCASFERRSARAKRSVSSDASVSAMRAVRAATAAAWSSGLMRIRLLGDGRRACAPRRARTAGDGRRPTPRAPSPSRTAVDCARGPRCVRARECSS